MRKLNFIVHGVDGWILVTHDNGRVWFSDKFRNAPSFEEGIVHVGALVVEEPHTIHITANWSNALHKVAHITALIDYTKVYVRLFVHGKLHHVYHTVVLAQRDVILQHYFSFIKGWDIVIKEKPCRIAFHYRHICLHKAVGVGVVDLVGDSIGTHGGNRWVCGCISGCFSGCHGSVILL